MSLATIATGQKFGVATMTYGQGMRVGIKFDTREEADDFAENYHGAVACKFSDGRWRELAK
jgi:hypothetical protein